MNNFLNRDNVSTIWDVISDEVNIKKFTPDFQEKIASVFSSNIKGFYETEKGKTDSLVQLNKKYIMLLINYIKTNYQENKPKQIKILNESPIKELITYEEIHDDKKSKFERDLKSREEEFSSAMSLKVPEVPTFTDDSKDNEPIKEMDKLLKEMTKSRNYDIEQITSQHQTNATDWLSSQKTSLKNEKIVLTDNSLTYDKPFATPSEATSPTKKNVTWDDDDDGSPTLITPSYTDPEPRTPQDLYQGSQQDLYQGSQKEPDPEEINILSRFKKIVPDTTNGLRNMIDTNDVRLTNLEDELKSIRQKIDDVLERLSSSNK